METLGITTNGIALRRKLPALRAAGVNAINISLDTLLPERFRAITRRPGLERVVEAIRATAEGAWATVKINCVVMRGVNDDEVPGFVRLTRDWPVEVRFIEYMPFGANRWSDSKLVPFADMLQQVQAAFPDLAPVPASPHETAKVFRVPGYAGRVGFITSMSDHFCGGCTRLRLTADGSLKTCLFGTDEHSLRGPLRAGATDAQLAALVAAAVQRKRFALGGHGDMFGIAASDNRPMILIGG